MKIAFIGAGNMGLPMAQNLLKVGHEVHAYNRTRAHLEPLAQHGAVIADSAAEAARDGDAAGTMLADDHAVESVAHSLAEGLPAGAIHAGASTVSASCARR